MLVIDENTRVVRTFGRPGGWSYIEANVARYYRLTPGQAPYFLGWDPASSDVPAANWGSRAECIGNPHFKGHPSYEFGTEASLHSRANQTVMDVTELWPLILEAARASY